MSEPTAGRQIKFTFQGDTSKWDAKKLMKITRACVELLEAVDIAMNGKKTVDWHITELKKDD